MWEKIRKVFVLVILGVLSLICLIQTCKSFNTCSGLKRPGMLSSIDSKKVRYEKVMKIDYYCAFNDHLQKGTFLKVYSFFSVRLYNTEEYVLVAIPNANDTFLKGVDCFTKVSDAAEYDYSEYHSLCGRVKHLSEKERNILTGKEERPKSETASIPSTEENTNFSFYLEYLDPIKEKETLWKWLISFLIITTVFTLQILKYITEVKVDHFFEETERKNREAAKKLEAWKKEHGIFD